MYSPGNEGHKVTYAEFIDISSKLYMYLREQESDLCYITYTVRTVFYKVYNIYYIKYLDYFSLF